MPPANSTLDSWFAADGADDMEGARPGHRIELIESALAPLSVHDNDAVGSRLGHLRNDLAVVVSAEALFTLVDLKAMTPDGAVASVIAAARRLVAEAIRDLTS